jgi:hypothetical protein
VPVAPLGRIALISLGVGILVSIILLFVEMEKGNPKVNRCAAVCVLMATLWVTEVIPLAATSLVPLFAFPLLSVGSAAGVASQYFNGAVFSPPPFTFPHALHKRHWLTHTRTIIHRSTHERTLLQYVQYVMRAHMPRFSSEPLMLHAQTPFSCCSADSSSPSAWKNGKSSPPSLHHHFCAPTYTPPSLSTSSIRYRGLHIRIALRIMLIFGTKPKFLLLGTMVSTWFLSMWISNTVKNTLI